MKKNVLCLFCLFLILNVHSQTIYYHRREKKQNKSSKIVSQENKFITDTTLNKSIVLRNLLFSRASDVILPSSYEELEELAQYLQKHKDLKIKILGHTEIIGDPQQNLELSRDRAKAVRNFLVSQGVERERIIHLGFGNTMPLDTANTEEARKRNRRVEFQFIK